MLLSDEEIAESELLFQRELVANFEMTVDQWYLLATAFASPSHHDKTRGRGYKQFLKAHFFSHAFSA